jgi:hypothetical protein
MVEKINHMVKLFNSMDSVKFFYLKRISIDCFVGFDSKVVFKWVIFYPAITRFLPPSFAL